MILQTTLNDGVARATILPSEANLAISEQFKEEMMNLIVNGSQNVIVSFENVGYIDSSFLGSLVVALKYAMPRGIDIYLVALKPDVHDLLKLIRMDKVFKIYKTYEEAMVNL